MKNRTKQPKRRVITFNLPVTIIDKLDLAAKQKDRSRSRVATYIFNGFFNGVSNAKEKPQS